MLVLGVPAGINAVLTVAVQPDQALLQAPYPQRSLLVFDDAHYIGATQALRIGAVMEKAGELSRAWAGFGWHIVLQLLLFFIVGYFVLLIFIVLEPDNKITFLFALILCAGSFFVYFIVQMSNSTLVNVYRMQLLAGENVRIKNTRRRLQSILDNVAESIITFTPDGVIESCNSLHPVEFQ